MTSRPGAAACRPGHDGPFRKAVSTLANSLKAGTYAGQRSGYPDQARAKPGSKGHPAVRLNMMAAITAPGGVQQPIHLGGQWAAAAEHSAGPRSRRMKMALVSGNTSFPRFFPGP